MDKPEKLPVIRCAVCKKPVEGAYWSRDLFTDMLFIRVNCHGQTDSMTAPADALYEMKRAGRMEAEAFANSQLTAPA